MAQGKTVWLLALLSLCLSAADSFTHLSFNVCRWCEASSPICRDRVCFSNCSLSSFCSSTDEVCIAVWKKLNKTMTVQTMCHHPALPLEGVDPAVLQNVSSRECHMFPQPTEEGAMMVCSCKGEHECNDRLIFDQGANGFSKLQSQELVPVVLVSLVPPILVALLATAAFYFYRTRLFIKKPGKPCQRLYQSIDPTLQVERGENITSHLQNVESDPKITAFGNTMERRENLTMPLPIQLETLVGKGRFAEVWKARLVQLDDKTNDKKDNSNKANNDKANKANDNKDNSDKDNDNNTNDNKDNSDKDNSNSGNDNKDNSDEDNSDKAIDNRASCDNASSHVVVAVKVFPAVEYASWRNECEIFFDPKLRHENIVLFLAAEERGGPGHGHRKYWLVLEYHGLGNLQEFLTENTLSWEELIAMAKCIAKGLAHLHSDTTPKGEPKVPVAHRDLKSSNIVVKSRKDCALCDFGLALRLDMTLTVDDYANSGQVGTARYMAPEVLESRVNLEDLEAFKQIDVYSMALVLWEMASRCQTIGEMKSFEPAFGSRVCDQPCVDSMRDLVLRDRGRPDIPSAWTLHQGMSVFCSTVTECWDHDPEARLTADCVVERFTALQNEDDTDWNLNQEEVHEQVQGQVQDIREGSGLSTDLDQHQNNSRDSDSDFQSSSIFQTLHSATSSSFQESETDEQRNSAEARLVASAV